jgi:alkylation response protein AidB-like acyl-CoA dehydrogenase
MTKLNDKAPSLATTLAHLLRQEPELLSFDSTRLANALWQRMADEKILTPRLSTPTNTQTHPYTEVVQAAAYLSHQSGLPGLAMTWLAQQRLIEIIARCENSVIKDAYLADLLAGNTLCALAVSEPKVGAHPKHLSTRADKVGTTYRLNGEKTYVTNGLNAAFFIVFAITDVVDKRKQFTAFIVPKDCKGLSISPLHGFDALKPSSHCTLLLNDCALPDSHILGDIGNAFDDISKPFREYEDVLMLAPLAGAMQSLIDQLCAHDAELIANDTLGQLLAITESVEVLSSQAASQLEQTDQHTNPISLIISGRLLVEHFNQTIKQLSAEQPLNDAIKRLIKDIEVLSNIAQSVNKIKQTNLAIHYRQQELT